LTSAFFFGCFFAGLLWTCAVSARTSWAALAAEFSASAMEAIVRHHEIVTELFLRMKSYGQKKMETFCGHWEMSWKNYLRKQ